MQKKQSGPKYNYVQDTTEVLDTLSNSQMLLGKLISPFHPSLSRELTMIILRIARIKVTIKHKPGNSNENTILRQKE